MSDYDGAWKESVEQFFEPFVEFLFPEVHTDIDWSRGIEFLDTELQQIQPDADSGLRIVDKLVRVWRLDGREDWVLAHFEVQGDRTQDFEERMFVCHYRIFDKYQRRVATLVVLADENSAWRPHEYFHELWGCRIRFEFPTVKLLDLAADWPKLEAHPNPFAILVMAYLKAKELRNDPKGRYSWKVRFFRGLFDHGWSRQLILDVFHKIDWFLALPEDLEIKFRQESAQIEGEKHMPYVTSIERLAKKEGREEGRVEGRIEGQSEGLQAAICEALEEKFGVAGESIADRAESISDLTELRRLLRVIVRAASVDEVQAAFPQGS